MFGYTCLDFFFFLNISLLIIDENRFRMALQKAEMSEFASRHTKDFVKLKD